MIKVMAGDTLYTGPGPFVDDNHWVDMYEGQ